MNGYSAFLLKLTLPASKIIMRVRFVPMEQTMQQSHVPDEQEIVKALKGFSINLLKIYPSSFSFTNGLFYGLIRTPDGKRLAVLGDKGLVLADPFRGTCFHAASTLKVCDLSPENTECLMTFFPYTKPVPILKQPFTTIGTGDRLGIATPGHLRAVRKFRSRPILAQQSVRENNQTGRSFKDVVQDAAWGVFQENYRHGYGADGDHLKSFQEIKTALDGGVSMVTLDLSEKLNPMAFHDSRTSINHQFKEEIDEGDAKVLSHLFLERSFDLKGPNGEHSIRFTEESLKRNALLYQKAIDFTEEAYEWIRSEKGFRTTLDFEISIDETPFPTSPENHLFFIIALSHRGVRIDSLAPRFIGEFQKGIDYRGDVKAFKEQFYQHCLIAQYYGNYKISIHSGSDKFSVFPEIGKLAADAVHLKTAGTSWLEAMRLIAQKSPTLYREMHQFAISVFPEATKLYVVTTDLGRIPKLESLKDEELPMLLEQEDARQLLHIAYGFLLNARDREERLLFRNRFFNTLNQYEEDYWSLLERHIGTHLVSLGVGKGEAA